MATERYVVLTLSVVTNVSDRVIFSEVPKTLRAMPDIRTDSVRFQLVRNKTSRTEKSLSNIFC